MRLQKRGRRRDYHSRIVVTEASRGTHSGNYVDLVGSYDHKQGTIKLDKEKAADWIAKGVQPSVTVHNMLVSEGVIVGDKKNPLPKKSAPVVESPAEEAPAEESQPENEETSSAEGGDTEEASEPEASEGASTVETTEENTEA